MLGCRGLLTVAIFGGGIAFTADAATPTPQNLSATIQDDPSGIFLTWSPVDGATSYQVRIYTSLFTTTAEATISTTNTAYLNGLPCGFTRYYEVQANGPEGLSAASPRVFGQSPDCPFAVPNCDVAAVAVTGAGAYTGNTVGQFNDYEVSEIVGPCDNGIDPGTAGVARDVVYRYTSAVDCTLTVRLQPTDLEYNAVLYMSETCEPRRCNEFSDVIFGPEEITFPVSARQDYFLFVDGFNNLDNGPYEISFITGDCRGDQNCDLLQEGFSEGGLPEGWTSINSDSIPDGDGGRHKPQSWAVMEDLAGPLYNRVAAAYADPEVNANTEDWLISGPVNIGEDAVLRWRDARLGAEGTFLFNVYAAQSPSIPALVSNGPLLSLNLGDLESDYTQREIALAPEGVRNGAYYFAFYHFARQTGYLFIDDVGVCAASPDPEGEGEGEGAAEGEPPAESHSADQNGDQRIALSELLRVIQFFNSGGLHCAVPPLITEDGYSPGANPARLDCVSHNSDYNPQNWVISLSELLRLIQLFNSGGLFPCLGSEDGFCPGIP